MRIDKFLKISRLIKRRTLANEACEQERVLLNGKTAKPGSSVKAGDEIEIRFGNHTTRIRINTVEDRVLKSDAKLMYDIIF